MKTRFFGMAFVIMAVVMCIFSSCKKEEEKIIPKLSLDVSDLKFGKSEDSKVFVVDCNVGWTASASEDWISVSPQSGKYKGTVAVTVEDNTKVGESRQGKVVVRTTEGGLEQTVRITQTSNELVLEAAKSALTFKSEGGTQTIQISANVKWKLVSSQPWLSVSEQSGNGEKTVTVTAEANTTNGERTASLTLSRADGNSSSNPFTISVTQAMGEISVSPTSISLLAEKGSATSLVVTASGTWTLSGVPEWLHTTASSGVGQTSVTLTALSDNFSDEDRKATLNFTSGAKTVPVQVSQAPYLAVGCKVEMPNITLMSNGFASDLKFGSRAKGYREAFFSTSDIASMTERDIYNLLMEEKEYTSTADYTFSPIVSPGTTFVYCVAAYGNENYADGSHKYGPMTMKTFTTPSRTLWADMPIYGISYTSTRWAPITQKQGAMGTRCQKYYYFDADGELAETLYTWYLYAPDAFLAHFIYKGVIAEDPNHYAIAPQTFSYTRTNDKFFFGTWGVDDTNTFSNEILSAYIDLSESENVKPMTKQPVAKSNLNEKRKMPSTAEIKAAMKRVRAVRVR